MKSLPNYSVAKAAQAIIDREVTEASAALQGFPRGAMGLTPDAVKFSPEYRAAKKRYDTAAASLREFNTVFLRSFPNEIREERRQRRGG